MNANTRSSAGNRKTVFWYIARQAAALTTHLLLFPPAFDNKKLTGSSLKVHIDEQLKSVYAPAQPGFGEL